mgnify:CR=1 FL=1
MAGVGDRTVFSVLFLNASGVAADPTTVQFRLREEIDGTELYWDIVPTTPTGMNAIDTSGATGIFTLSFVNRKTERLTGTWIGAGNGVNQTKTQTFFVRHSLIEALEP